MPAAHRPRRSVLAVPGSSDRMLAKAQTLASDAVFLDLEDAVAPSEKAAARARIVDALATGDWRGRTVTVRINDAASPLALDDLVSVVRGLAERGRLGVLDAIMLPKVVSPADVVWLDRTLGMLEAGLGHAFADARRERADRGEPTAIGIEAQIEDPGALLRAAEIVDASARVETLVYGPGDFMAAMRVPSLTIGDADRAGGAGLLDAAFAQLAFVARSRGIQVIDGPYAVIADADGLRTTAERARAFGFDGKWVLHPAQIDVVNEVFTPSREVFERALRILEAYDAARLADADAAGAVLVDGEMVDEATRKMALVQAEIGRRAGLGG